MGRQCLISRLHCSSMIDKVYPLQKHTHPVCGFNCQAHIDILQHGGVELHLLAAKEVSNSSSGSSTELGGFFKARDVGLQLGRPTQASALHNVGLPREVPCKPKKCDCFCTCHVVTPRHRLEQHPKCMCLPTAMHTTPWACITLCTPTSMQEIARIEIDIFNTIQNHICCLLRLANIGGVLVRACMLLIAL